MVAHACIIIMYMQNELGVWVMNIINLKERAHNNVANPPEPNEYNNAQD